MRQSKIGRARERERVRVRESVWRREGAGEGTRVRA